MQNSNTPSCNIEQQKSTREYKTFTKKQYEYYKKFFSNTPGVKVIYRQRTPEEELEAAINQIIAYSLGEKDIYRE